VLASLSLLLATNAILRIRPLLNWTACGFVVVLMLFVDSRNMFLFSVIVIGAYYTAKYASYYVLWLGVALSGTGAAWLVDRYPLLVDLATSGRITLWRQAEYSFLGKGTEISSEGGAPLARFHMDNYYLEYLVENGVYTIVLAIVLAFLLGYILRYTRDPRWRRLKVAVAVAFLFSCIFDAGMFSTGNLLNIVAWVYLLAGDHIFASGAVHGAAREPVTIASPSLLQSPAG
jgi:hypothetical protein